MSQSPPQNSNGTPPSPRRVRRPALLAAVGAVLLAAGALSLAGLGVLPVAGWDGGGTSDARAQADDGGNGAGDGGGDGTAPATDPSASPAASASATGSPAPAAPGAAGTEPAPAPSASASDRLPADPLLPEPARDAVLGYIDTAAAMAAEPPPADGGKLPAPDYSGIAAGAALGELTAQFEEFQTNQWTVDGTPELAVRGIEDLEADGTAVRRVSLCIDSSAVQLTDRDGQILLAAEPPGTRTALNYYDLQEIDGAWRVVSHSFPDDPAC
ncbi:hypothetical protein [Arthrobacter gengyunqii]|uniref:Nuclear transport factor 2 family protein n=1 Tax=Arthrobacter gengyunqii TaxID=2886940 RepID=A0ABS8GJ30_9MICC|nr:hypothetical protein [Arthrobacter gengyunqii]MCC3266584.1 hypothetical protein [Arthrobacter gengyunqii]